MDASLLIPKAHEYLFAKILLRRCRISNLLSATLLSASTAWGMCGCGQSSPFSGGSSSGSGSGSTPQFTVVSAVDLGALPTNADILGRDGAYSAAFQGKAVWLYGDTFLANANLQNRTLISNSWSSTSDLNAQDSIGDFQEQLDSAGAPTMILQETSDERAFNQAHNSNNCHEDPCGARWALWPMSIVVDPATDTAMVFYSVVSALPGNFNFHSIGSSVAIWQDLRQPPQRPTLNPPVVADHRDLIFNENEPNFGSTAFMSNEFLYIYGCGVPNHATDKGCRLARVAPASVQDRAAWTFYRGNGNWSSRLSDAVSIFNGDDILSVSWNAYLRQYLAVYSQVLSQNVMIRTSPDPEGPWSDEITAFTAMSPAEGNVYDAHAHPEYDGNGGQTIYITYSRSTPVPFSSEVRLVAIQLQPANTQTQSK
jgi:hypothetical protein